MGSLQRRSRRGRAWAPRLLASSLLAAGAALYGQTGLVPLSELGAPYLGMGEPGLYPGGANEATGAHLAVR